MLPGARGQERESTQKYRHFVYIRYPLKQLYERHVSTMSIQARQSTLFNSFFLSSSSHHINTKYQASLLQTHPPAHSYRESHTDKGCILLGFTHVNVALLFHVMMASPRSRKGRSQGDEFLTTRGGKAIPQIIFQKRKSAPLAQDYIITYGTVEGGDARFS